VISPFGRLQVASTARACVLSAALGAGLAACAATPRDATQAPRLPPDGVGDGDHRVLARVAGQPILAGEVTRAARLAGTDVRAALEDRIRFEVLARAAEAAGVSPGPEDREILRQAQVERLVADLIEPRLAAGAIPESEVRAFYDRVHKRFVHGRLVQVAVLCIFTGARMKPEPRARAARHAESLRAYLGSHPGLSDQAFLALGSDPAWTEQKVSFSATTVWQDEEEPFPPVVGRAVSRLAHRGETTDVVGDETGFYAARYLAERPPENVSFAAARPILAAEMWDPWRRQKFLTLTLDFAGAHTVEAFPDNFRTMVSTATEDSNPGEPRP
jgi:hypothetical protein